MEWRNFFIYNKGIQEGSIESWNISYQWLIIRALFFMGTTLVVHTLREAMSELKKVVTTKESIYKVARLDYKNYIGLDTSLREDFICISCLVFWDLIVHLYAHSWMNTYTLDHHLST